MSQINKNSILLTFQGPIHMAASSPNTVVIAGGTASIPTGRPFTVESSQFSSSHGDVVGVDGVQPSEGRLPTGPGIQIFGEDQEIDDGQECCCECCCQEPEPPLIVMRPASDCPCPRAQKTVIGVFIDGITNSRNLLDAPETHERKQRDTDDESAIRDLCTRYGSESWLYRGLRMPFDAESQARKIADALIDRICRNHQWIQSERRWEQCEPIEIDLFGFSRGGATAVLVAHHLGKKFSCPDCPSAEPLGPFTVRFLGIIDPEGRALPDIGIFPRRDIDGTDRLPSNVKYFYAAYSDQHTLWTSVDHSAPAGKSMELEDELVTKDFHISHEKMGKAGFGPASEMEKFYEKNISDPEIPDSTSDVPCVYSE